MTTITAHGYRAVYLAPADTWQRDAFAQGGYDYDGNHRDTVDTHVRLVDTTAGMRKIRVYGDGLDLWGSPPPLGRDPWDCGIPVTDGSGS